MSATATTHEALAIAAKIEVPDGEIDVDKDECTDLAETGNEDAGESGEEWEDEVAQDYDKF